MRYVYCFYIVLIILAGLIPDTVTRIVLLAGCGGMMLVVHHLELRQAAHRLLSKLRATLTHADHLADSDHIPADDPAPPDRAPTAE